MRLLIHWYFLKSAFVKGIYMNIYVGNLSWGVTDEELEQVFGEFGAVESANVIKDRETGRSKGFGFIEMENDDEAEKAIEDLNGKSLGGRDLKVNQARPKEDKPRQTRSW